jgi:hypothetical protein
MISYGITYWQRGHTKWSTGPVSLRNLVSAEAFVASKALPVTTTPLDLSRIPRRRSSMAASTFVSEEEDIVTEAPLERDAAATARPIPGIKIM